MVSVTLAIPHHFWGDASLPPHFWGDARRIPIDLFLLLNGVFVCVIVSLY
jgi:hypothetical protein